MTEQEINKLFAQNDLHVGKMISYSKTAYRNKFKDHEVHFNANIFSAKLGKIWWGDIDLTTHGDKLQEIANILDDDLFILRELDGRFENEDLPLERVKERAVKFYLAS